MATPDAKYLALIADAIRRAHSVTVSDVQLGIAIAMCDQLQGVRPRRAAKKITTLNMVLRTHRDRSLAAAFPAIYFSSLVDRRHNVSILVDRDTHAREDAELYRAILEQLSARTEVRGPGQVPGPQVNIGDTITIATPEEFARTQGRQELIIARVSPEATKRLRRQLPGIATLPEG